MKSYMNNLPVIVPKSTRPTIPKPRPTSKSTNREFTVTAKKPIEILQFNDENIDPHQEQLELNETDLLKKQHQEELQVLRKQLEQKQLENDSLQRKLKKTSFDIEYIKTDDALFHFYSGFPDYETFRIFYDSISPVAEKLIYYKSNTNTEKLSKGNAKCGPKRSLSQEQELFLVLTRLRCGLLEKDIAHRAGISAGYFSRVFITWIDFLYARLRCLPIWASKQTVEKTMPSCFQESYPSTRVIIDATEIFLEMPSSLRSQSETYSNYKHHNTAKGVVGIAPSGLVTFVSDLYAGRCSDKAITKDCGILDLLEEGDSVMADKGFTIEDDLPVGTFLNIPPFLKNHASLTLEEETETRRIASVRVHVERAIRRIKTFRILKTVFPISMSADLNKIWVVCAYLTNFLPPLINSP